MYRAATRSPATARRNSCSCARMLWAVAAASSGTTRLPLTIAANPDVVVISAITPAILAWKRGDAPAVRSMTHSLKRADGAGGHRRGPAVSRVDASKVWPGTGNPVTPVRTWFGPLGQRPRPKETTTWAGGNEDQRHRARSGEGAQPVAGPLVPSRNFDACTWETMERRRCSAA